MLDVLAINRNILIHALWSACQVRALGAGVVFMNTGLSSLLFWTGANGLRSAREASAKQTMSGGVRICVIVMYVIFLSKSKGKMLVQTGIRWYHAGDMLCVQLAESVCGVSVGSH